MALNHPLFTNPTHPTEPTVDGRTLLHEKKPQSLHVEVVDASPLAQLCQEQVSALAALASMSRKDAMLTGEEWWALLEPIADQLMLLRKMLNHGIDIAENHLVRMDR